jgi:hypothetical protein
MIQDYKDKRLYKPPFYPLVLTFFLSFFFTTHKHSLILKTILKNTTVLSTAISDKSPKINNQQCHKILTLVDGIELLVVGSIHKCLLVSEDGTKGLVEPHFHMANL